MKKTSTFGIFIVLLGALFYCYEYFLRIAPSVMQQDLMQTFNIDATLFGTLSGFYYYAYSPMQLFVGIALDRYHLKYLLPFSILCCVLGSVLFVSSQHYEVVAFGRFLQGFGSAFAFVGALKLASRWLPVWWFAAFSGICTSIGFLGGAAGDIALSNMVKDIGWRATIESFAIIGLVLTLITYFALTYASRLPNDRVPTSVAVGNLKQAFLQLWALLHKPYIWVAGIIGGLLFLPTIVFAELWGIPYLQKLHGYSLTQAGLASSMIYIGWAIGSPFPGIISNLLKKRMRVLWVGSLIAMVLSVLVLYDASLTFVQVCIVFILFGIVSSVECITFAMGRDVCTEETTGMAVAFVNFLVMVSGMFMQSFVGWLIDIGNHAPTVNGVLQYSLHDYQRAVVVVPISLLLAMMLALVMRDKPLKLSDH